MPTIVAASESQVLVDGQPIEGVRTIEYRHRQARNHVYGLGSTERIGVVSGAELVEGVMQVASTEQRLNALTPDQPFQLIAHLKHGKTTVTIEFHDCFLSEKGLSLAVGDVGYGSYSFTATRVREEVAAG